MFFELNEEQEQLQSSIRSFFEGSSAAHTLVRRAEKRSDRKFDDDLLRRLGVELDVLGAAVPEARGGSGAGLVELFVIFREMGRVLYGGPFLSSVLSAEVLVHADRQGTYDALLTSLLKGKSRCAVAGLKWGGPNDLVAVEKDGAWSVSGRADFVFDAAHAGTFLLFAETPNGTGCFIVEDPGAVTKVPIDLLDLTRSAAHLLFDGVVSSYVAVGEVAATTLKRVLDVAVLCVAAEQVGVAERALEIAVEHAKLRVQFGAPIGSFQAVKHRCADAAVAVEAAKATGLHAAWAIDCGIERDQPLASFAKSVCSEASVKVTGSAIQVLGGIGYTWEHPIHLYFRRAISSRQSFGSTSAHRDRIAAQLLDNA